MNSKITIDVGDFEHLLNCLANQKFINEQTPEVQKEWQEVIDAAWNKGMKELSDHRNSQTLLNDDAIRRARRQTYLGY